MNVETSQISDQHLLVCLHYDGDVRTGISSLVATDEMLFPTDVFRNVLSEREESSWVYNVSIYIWEPEDNLSESVFSFQSDIQGSNSGHEAHTACVFAC